MSGQPYLLALMFGPVQGFIAAARRTRDLWFGSWVLSEISKAGAKGLLDHAAGRPEVKLIFPHATVAELEPESGLSVANKIVAHIEADDPRAYATAARNAAIARWHALATDCANEFKMNNIEVSVWKKQIADNPTYPVPDDLVECYAAWVPLPPGADYGAATKRLNELLNARKATREFAVAAVQPDDPLGHSRKKSSLDAARESVLQPSISDKQRRRFGIDRGEELDAPGLVKRVLGRGKSFTALARVACEPWVRMMRKQQPGKLYDIARQYDDLVKTDSGLAARAYRYTDFPFDAQLVYKYRLQNLLQNSGGKAADVDPNDLVIVDKINALIHSIRLPAPDSYVAVLIADGDGMGKLIDGANLLENHQALSRQLADFAKAAPGLISGHGGECVYAGGDDVLAFVPVAYALDCAQQLADEFAATLCAVPWIQALPAEQRPTLSVGLAFGHILTPLGTLRQLAAEAEKIAKRGIEDDDTPGNNKPGNALGIVISPRSGSVLKWRGRWDDNVDGKFADGAFTGCPGFRSRLAYWIEHFANDAISDRAGYQLRQLQREFASNDEALAAEAQRLIARKSTNADIVQRTRDFLLIRKARALHTEWIAARWLSQHRKEIWS